MSFKLQVEVVKTVLIFKILFFHGVGGEVDSFFIKDESSRDAMSGGTSRVIIWMQQTIPQRYKYFYETQKNCWDFPFYLGVECIFSNAGSPR